MNRQMLSTQNSLDINALLQLGKSAHAQERLTEAEFYYTEILQLQPRHAEALYLLGGLCYQAGAMPQAIDYYNRSLEVSRNAFVLNARGVAQNLLGQGQAAEVSYQAAIALKPEYWEPHYNLGRLLAKRRAYQAALLCYQQAIALKPQHWESWWAMADTLMHLEQDEEAQSAYNHALSLCPNHPLALWKKCLAIPSFYQVEAQITEARNRFMAGLDQLIASTDLSHAAGVEDAFIGSELANIFYLAYQGYNDCPLQVRFGQLLHEVMAAKFPQWAKPLAIQPKAKIRVGYISCFFYQHTVGYLSRGWLNLEDSFEVYVYNESEQDDEVSRQYQSRATRYCCFVDWSLDRLAAQILADQLDILVYTDIGMSSNTYQLAALRLAPVQCTSWGHPVTSGLPTLDYFLSSELMKPDEGDEHYCETLVRLPNLGFSIEPLPLAAPPPQGRQGFDLDKNALVLASCQSYFKYLPQYDWVFPEIVKQLHSADVPVQIIFMNSTGKAGNPFAIRITEAFRKAGVPAGVCTFSLKFSPTQFVQVLQVSDLFLDTFDWSGGRTTLEALAVGLPVITCPGMMMRGRHSYGILKFLGLEQQLAVSTPSEYVDLVVKLGCDPLLRLQMRQAIAARRLIIWNDTKAIEGLQEFCRQAVRNCPHEKVFH